MGRGLAQESREGRCDCRPLRRSSCGGLSTPNRRRAVPTSISGAAGQVRSGIECGQDTTDRIRALCRSRPEAAWRGKTRDLHILGLYPLLWAAHQWSFIVWRIMAKKRMVAKLKAIK